MGDVRAVLDAVRSSSTVLLGSQDGCSMAARFAATYPERTRALALFHPIVHFPHGEIEGYEASLALLRDRWGTQEHSDEMLSWNAL